MKKSYFLLVLLCLSLAPVEASAQQTKQLVILEKPAPELPDKYGTLDVSGTVKLKVEFVSDGKIGNVVPVSSPHPLLTQRAVEAAKRIKFSPEMQDGVAVTIDKFVEYEYSWNGGWKRPQSEVRPSNPLGDQAEKAEAVLKRAIEKIGGEKYLQIKTVYGKGAFSQFKDGAAVGYSNFTDIIVFPDKERTEFKAGGYKTIQTNYGESGWIYGEDTRSVNDQTKTQVDDFKRGIRVSLDNLLRGSWRNQGVRISYVGRRPATLGTRNEVIKLTYGDDFWVEFEFAAADGLPAKASYEHKDGEGEVRKEEDRYAQFIDVQGVMAPFVIDHFRDGKQTSRINYNTMEYNKNIPASVFTKPADIKEAKKDLKF
jgi:TonB family protein